SARPPNDFCRNRHASFRPRRGTCVAVGPVPKATRVGVGSVLVQLGGRTIPLGIAAVVLGFVLRLPGTQADPADTGPRGSGVSVFGTIHPDLLRISRRRVDTPH